MTRGEVTLRRATEADVPTVLELIRGIAEYERLGHEVEATEALLRTHGFGPRPIFEAILAEADGRLYLTGVEPAAHSQFRSSGKLDRSDAVHIVAVDRVVWASTERAVSLAREWLSR